MSLQNTQDLWKIKVFWYCCMPKTHTWSFFCICFYEVIYIDSHLFLLIILSPVISNILFFHISVNVIFSAEDRRKLPKYRWRKMQHFTAKYKNVVIYLDYDYFNIILYAHVINTPVTHVVNAGGLCHESCETRQSLDVVLKGVDLLRHSPVSLEQTLQQQQLRLQSL